MLHCGVQSKGRRFFMLKITPYLGVFVLLVSIGGIFYPKLGYFVLLVMLTFMILAPFRGRWFCGNLCPHGSFADFWLGAISHRRAMIPPIFSSLWIRIPIFIALMGFMIFRLIGTQGMVDKVGMFFVANYIMMASFVTIFGISITTRAWCTICPMGTLQRAIGGKKYPLKIDQEKCIDCKTCQKACPMQLPVNELKEKPDCIKCERCIEACPKEALSF